MPRGHMWDIDFPSAIDAHNHNHSSQFGADAQQSCGTKATGAKFCTHVRFL